ncbi:hypothetical protein DIPPA_10566 [Diplonema papillatum]|nr:hypothetical protein DIPPA_10566 [Diplonema papillatum]
MASDATDSTSDGSKHKKKEKKRHRRTKEDKKSSKKEDKKGKKEKREKREKQQDASDHASDRPDIREKPTLSRHSPKSRSRVRDRLPRLQPSGGAEQPQPLSTPKHVKRQGSSFPPVTPRGDRPLHVLDPNHPGSLHSEHPMQPFTIDPEDLHDCVPPATTYAHPHLPPLPTHPGYLGQYVQSALTGDFKMVEQAPVQSLPDLEDNVANTDKDATKKCYYSLRSVVQGNSLLLANLRGALAALFLLILLIALGHDDSDLLWFYKEFSSPLQKIVNFLAFATLSCALCPLALVSTLQPDRRMSNQQMTADEGGWCSSVLECWRVGGRQKAHLLFSRLYVFHLVQVTLYAGVVFCCVWTAAFDDVLWEYREQIDQEFKPRAPLVRRVGRSAGPAVPVSADYSTSDNCAGLVLGELTPQACQARGCCWDAGAEAPCAVPQTNPRLLTVEYSDEDEDYLFPFTYARAVESCAGIGSQLCSAEDICRGGSLTPEAAALTAESLVPVGNVWGSFLFTSTCTISTPTPRGRYGSLDVLCCRGCPQTFSPLDDVADIWSRVDSFRNVVLARFVLAIAGYFWGLYYQVYSIAQPDESSDEPQQDVRNEDMLTKRMASLSRLQLAINSKRRAASE